MVEAPLSACSSVDLGDGWASCARYCRQRAGNDAGVEPGRVVSGRAVARSRRQHDSGHDRVHGDHVPADDHHRSDIDINDDGAADYVHHEHDDDATDDSAATSAINGRRATVHPSSSGM